ncbi:MAG: protease family protein [Pseudonocardiales bacterium]|nr:protease family protein [Pseudonocardiales bacterium]
MSTTAPHRHPAGALSAFARRHQLTMFFALAYAFSWWAWVWYRLDPGNVDAPMFPPGPFVAALVMLALVGGRPAVRAWVGKILHWRVRPFWYAVALLVPVALTFAAVAAARATGASFVAGGVVPGATAVAGQFAFVLLWVGLGEEPAWRGYALPRLMAGRSALAAALLLGVLHVVWHAPLFGVEYHLAEAGPWALGVIAFSVVTAWVWAHTGGSLLLPMLMHASVNSVTFVWRWFAGPDQVRLWWIWAALWVLLAVGVVVASGPQLGRDPVTPVRGQGKP